MSLLKALQFIQLFSYLLVNCQLLFYLVVFADALKATPISNFLIHRQVVDGVMRKRYHIVYYSCLALSFVLVIVAALQNDPVKLGSSLIALFCLIVDLIIIVKVNVPLNNQVNTYRDGEDLSRWEIIRDKWLLYFRYRGIVSTIGMVSLVIGLMV